MVYSFLYVETDIKSTVSNTCLQQAVFTLQNYNNKTYGVLRQRRIFFTIFHNHPFGTNKALAS